VPSLDDDQPGYTREVAQEYASTDTVADPSAPAGTSRRRTRCANNLPLNEHYNEPVRNHVWHSKRRTWTRAELDRERIEFFETRVSGRPEIWAALATVITMIRAGDLATAQSIIDAVGITIPTGDLCEVCYDEQGVLYRLPHSIVSDPENMAQPFDITRSDDSSGGELIAEDVECRRDQMGKTSERDLIRVLARLSDRDGPDLVLSVGKSQSVGFLARKVHQEAEVGFAWFFFPFSIEV
jgi:hypothetical protein